LYIWVFRNSQVFRIICIAVFMWSYFMCEPSRCIKRNTLTEAEWVCIFAMQSVQMKFPWKFCWPDWQTRYVSVYHTYSFNYPFFFADSALIILEKYVSTEGKMKFKNYATYKYTDNNVWRKVYFLPFFIYDRCQCCLPNEELSFD
jgi:hypothetical protein